MDRRNPHDLGARRWPLPAAEQIPNSDPTGPLGAGTYDFSAVYTPAVGEPKYLTATSNPEPLSISQGTSSVSTAIFDSAAAR